MSEPSASEAYIESECAGAESQPRPGYANTGIEALIRRDGLRCCWCSHVLVPGRRYGRGRRRPTRDHVIPSSEGGSLHVHNILLSCQFCNQQRGTQSALEFLQVAQKPRRDIVLAAIARAEAHRSAVLAVIGG